MSDRYTMYGAQVSYYSGKVRSYLLKKGLSFDEVAVTLKTYRDIIVPETGVKYMPVVRTPDNRYLQDTTIIIESIEATRPTPSVLPDTPKQRFVAELLEVYADEWLVLPAMHYRWNFPEQNQPFIYQEFGRVALPWAPAFIRGWLGAKLGARFKKSVQSLGVSEQTIPAIEASYCALLDELEAHFAQHQFLLGNKPCIADFGFIGPLFAHLYRDPAPGALMRARAPKVVAWVERMMNNQAYLSQGTLLDNDEIPTTLEPILRRMAIEQYPVLQETNQALSAWRAKRRAEQNLEDDDSQLEVKRFIGTHDFRIADRIGQRVIIPYSLWMLQRVLERVYKAKLVQDPKFVKWLDNLNFAGILDFKILEPMQRRDNRLYFRSDGN